VILYLIIVGYATHGAFFELLLKFLIQKKYLRIFTIYINGLYQIL